VHATAAPLPALLTQAGETTAAGVNASGALATADATLVVTAILEAGRRSLDAGGAPVTITYAGTNVWRPSALVVGSGGGGSA
jgi:hypothetical protein